MTDKETKRARMAKVVEAANRQIRQGSELGPLPSRWRRSAARIRELTASLVSKAKAGGVSSDSSENVAAQLDLELAEWSKGQKDPSVGELLRELLVAFRARLTR